jgi:hypothetical protein
VPAWAHRWNSSWAKPAYDLGQLHRDLERFVFLLGGSDGEEPFGVTGEQ